MRIEDLRSEGHKGRQRVAARVIWEECDRPSYEVYFETDEAFADSLSCNPDAFLLACAVPALHYGEERVLIDAEVCPELKLGLTTAMSWLCHWFPLQRKPVRIEARSRIEPPSPDRPERAGVFFSGGIDSFATLRTNRLHFPPEHPWFIKDALIVYGLEVHEPESFKHVIGSLSEAAQKTGLTFIPIYTNLYLKYKQEDVTNGFRFWTHEFGGAALAAVAHALTPRLSVVSIAATKSIYTFAPWGSHPLLDPYYSSIDMKIRHDGITLSRFAKTKLVADWDVVRDHLRVCNQSRLYREGHLNCGKCEKCLRTMLAFLSLSMLDKTEVFPVQDVTEELVLSAGKIQANLLPHYEEMLEPLARIGRHDLVRRVERNIADFQAAQRKKKWKSCWVDPIAQFDTKYLGNILRKLKHSI